jgi:hypothetical protein
MFEWNTIMLGKLRNTNNIVNTYDEVSVLSSLSLSLSLSLDKNVYVRMCIFMCVYMCACAYIYNCLS